MDELKGAIVVGMIFITAITLMVLDSARAEFWILAGATMMIVLKN